MNLNLKEKPVNPSMVGIFGFHSWWVGLNQSWQEKTHIQDKKACDSTIRFEDEKWFEPCAKMHIKIEAIVLVK